MLTGLPGTWRRSSRSEPNGLSLAANPCRGVAFPRKRKLSEVETGLRQVQRDGRRSTAAAPALRATGTGFYARAPFMAAITLYSPWVPRFSRPMAWAEM